MDKFSAPYYCFSDDGGSTWSEPQKITPLEKFAKCADFRPLTLTDDSKAGIIGIVKGEKGYKSVYLFYDGTWSEAEPIKASWETNRLLQLFKKFKRMFCR